MAKKHDAISENPKYRASYSSRARPHPRIIRREINVDGMAKRGEGARGSILNKSNSGGKILQPSATVRIRRFDERDETKRNEGTTGLKRGA